MALLTSLMLVLGCGGHGWSSTIPTEIGVTSASATSITRSRWYSGQIPTQLGLLTLLDGERRLRTQQRAVV